MWQRVGAFAVGVALAGTAAGVPPARQAQYDQAQAAMDRGDWSTAAAGFAALLPADPHKPLTRSAAIIAARRGEALMHLGELDEARSLLGRAVANLPKDPSLSYVWSDAADAARFSYDYDLAARADRTAIDLALAAKDARAASTARIDLAQAVMTVDPNAAAATLDTVLTDDTTLEPIARAQVEALRARAAIIAGDRPTAERWVKSALARSGGLTETKVSAAQAEIRADAAIIARLAGDDETARKYLAYTGAGHLQNMDWLGRYSGELPTCDAAAGPKPDDSVVVRFIILEDGRVEAAIPVYTSQPGPNGALFAEAVSRWTWNPDDLKKANAFVRGTLRLELRCQSRPAPMALAHPYLAETAEWLASNNHLDAAQLAAVRQRADLRHAALQASDPLANTLFGRAGRDVPTLSPAEAQQALAAGSAPASAYAMLAFTRSMNGGNGLREAAGAQAAALGRSVPPLIERFPRDRSVYWLELEWALALEGAGRFAQARPLVAQVLGTPETVLPKDDPVRQVATLHAALIATRLGTPAPVAATAGLDAQQCSLFDTHPIPASTSLSSDVFPKDAMRWGFEGHVEEDFDIGPDGRVAHVRTVLAYPPFVFGPGTERAVQSFRYIPPTIGGQAVGCDSQMLRINYLIPH